MDGVVVKMEEINNSFDEEKDVPLIQHQTSFDVEPIVLGDSFSLKDIRRKRNMYSSLSDVKQDLSKILRKNKHCDSFFIKIYKNNNGYLSKLKPNKLKIFFNFDINIHNKRIYLKDFLEDEEFVKAITIEDQEFFLNIIHIPSAQQWKYSETLDDYHKYICGFLEYVRQYLCNGNTITFNWFMSWISHILQFPCKKTKTAVIISGCSVNGREYLTKILFQLFDGFINKLKPSQMSNQLFYRNGHNPNIFMIVDVNNFKKSILVGFKQIICGRTIQTSQMITNSAIPNYSNFLFFYDSFDDKCCVGDDYYFGLNVKSTKKKSVVDINYNYLISESKVDGFYESLMTYFMTKDLTGFNPSIIPYGNHNKTLSK
ncbi:hypothetical protein QTN25_000128 [Entamoeba marina]